MSGAIERFPFKKTSCTSNKVICFTMERELRERKDTKERYRTECEGLPHGWSREVVIRKSGNSAGRVDIYYYSPCGKKFRSKPQVADFLKGKVDLRNFDFRSGTMSNGLIRNCSSRKRKADVFTRDFAAPGLASTKIPLRQTAIKFTRQPVTVVNNSPIYVSGVDKKNESKNNTGQQPRPIFWEKCLQGLHVVDENDNDLADYELPSLFRPVGPKKDWTSLVNTLSTDLYLTKKSITGQNMSLKAFEKNPCVWLNTAQPLCAPFKVCDSDIRRQEERVQYIRKRLADAVEEYDYLKAKSADGQN